MLGYLSDFLAAGLAIPTVYGGLFDSFSADPLWFGKVNISESVGSKLEDIYFGADYPTAGMVLWFTMREVTEY